MSDKIRFSIDDFFKEVGSDFTRDDFDAYLDNLVNDENSDSSQLKSNHKKNKETKKKHEPKGVETLMDSTGESMDRYGFINKYLYRTTEENVPLIDDGLSILHGEKGLINYIINESLDAIDQILKNNKDKYYKNILKRNITHLSLYFLKKITLEELFYIIVETEESNFKDIVWGFLNDKRYSFMLIEKVYLFQYIASAVLEINSRHDIDDIDISGLKWTFDVMRFLKYKKLTENEKIIKCTIYVGKDDNLIDVVIETQPGQYSEKELLSETYFFHDEFITYDNRYSEEQTLKKKYPNLDSNSITNMAFSKFQQGKTRGAQQVSVYNDLQWKLSYIQPLLNSFELEVSLISEDLLKTYRLNKKHIKKSNVGLFNVLRELEQSKALFHKINLLNKLIEINVYAKPDNNLDTNKHFRNKLVEFNNSLHKLRGIRNDVAHSNPITEDDIEYVLSEIEDAIDMLHALKTARKIGSNQINKDTNLPEWFTSNAQLVYQSVMTFSLDELKFIDGTQNDMFQ